MASWNQLKLKHFTIMLAALFIASVSISAIWITKAEASRRALIAEQHQSEHLQLVHIRGNHAQERLKQLVVNAKIKQGKGRQSWIQRRNQREKEYIKELVDYHNHAYHRIHYRTVYQPKITPGAETIMFVYSTITAMSAETRKAIRETWGNKTMLQKKGIMLCFVLGKRAKPGNAEQRIQESYLSKEHDMYGDILLFDFVDSYQNLTIKTVSMIRWFLNTPNSAKYLIKCDSDVLLNIDNMMPLIQKTYHASPNFILGHNINITAPNRQTASKWFVPLQLYSKIFYPEFVSGTTYVISKTAAELISKNFASMDYLYLEDVFITGLCRYGTGISLVHSDKFIIKQPSSLTDVWGDCVSLHGYAGLGPDIRRNWQLINGKKVAKEKIFEANVIRN